MMLTCWRTPVLDQEMMLTSWRPPVLQNGGGRQKVTRASLKLCEDYMRPWFNFLLHHVSLVQLFSSSHEAAVRPGPRHFNF